VPEVRRDFLERVRFRLAAQFEEEIEDCTLLLQQLEAMCARLAAFLRSRQRGIQAFELSLHHRDLAPTRVILRFVTPVNQPEQIAAVIKEHLLRTPLPAPVRSARIRSGQLLDIQASTGCISFAAGACEFRERGPEEILRLLERLRARLGESALYRLEVIADHRPEKASGKYRDFSIRTGGTAAGIAICTRPLWLLDPPRPLEEQHGWPCHEGVLGIEGGPERIESGWWDGEDTMRDYYSARTPAGIRVWIYRNRRAPYGWFLHGFFG
jgi:protein ImuB